MRRNEKARLARRDEYQQQRRQNGPQLVTPRTNFDATTGSIDVAQFASAVKLNLEHDHHVCATHATRIIFLPLPEEKDNPLVGMAREFWAGELIVDRTGSKPNVQIMWTHSQDDLCAKYGFKNTHALRLAQEPLGIPVPAAEPLICADCGVSEPLCANCEAPDACVEITFGTCPSRTAFTSFINNEWLHALCKPCLDEQTQAERAIREQREAERGRLRARFGERYVRDCPECGGVLYFRNGRNNGMFIACSSWPRCDHREPIVPDMAAPKPDLAEIGRAKAALANAPKCPSCGAALRHRVGTRGPFMGCSAWPRCNYTESIPTAPPAAQGDDVIVSRFE
jgi:ssDNA-binding Zn-finger/Zn-ribbon topoisomerase 1